MSSNTSEKLDKIIKRLDILTVILLAQAGLKRKEIAEALGVSEKTIERKKSKEVKQELTAPVNVEDAGGTTSQ